MAENNALTARPIVQRFIELTGTVGEFNLDSKAVKVRYFSTVASSQDSGAHNLELLKELKPMRERVRASELKDLDSLLQRNLNDYRVATDLIPYLLKSMPEVAFFTPILSVLIPKDSLNKEEESDYPIGVKETATNGNTIFDYKNLWKLELFKIGDKESNLGILSFDPNTVDLVVLDGQHRANAFRVVAGAFSDKENPVYPAFYSQITPPKNFNADLPVTIIWFEVTDSKFDPKIVSRRLFVDVNNTAKRVSTSRTILLEENELISAIVRFFYSTLARSRSFERDKFSLFHSGFDIDSDIAISSDNPFSLTNPQIFYDIVGWLTLGSRRYNKLDSYGVSREAFKSSAIAFGSIFNGEFFSSNDIVESEERLDNRRMIIKDSKKSADFYKEYVGKLHNTLISFYDKFNLLSIHYKACNSIENWYTNGMSAIEMSAWKDIFCGGESLYYVFKDSSIVKDKKEALGRYIQAIKSIEERFYDERANLLAGIDKKELKNAFESVNTKAFQIGVFMALDVFKSNDSFEDSYEEFFSKMNSISEKNWVYVLTVIRGKLMPHGATPKLWPVYQKLILRLIQDTENQYYSQDNFIESPDGRIFRQSLETSFDAWYEANDTIDETTMSIDSVLGLIENWANKAKQEIEELFRPIGKVIIPGKYQEEAKKVLEDVIKKITG